MILERRATHWIPKPTQPKQTDTTSYGTAGSALGTSDATGGKDKDKDNPTEKNPVAEEKGEKEPVTIDGEGHGDPEEKDLNGNGDGSSNVPAESDVAKTRAAHVTPQQTAQQTSPTSAQEPRQLTYNPITHAPSTYEFK